MLTRLQPTLPLPKGHLALLALLALLGACASTTEEHGDPHGAGVGGMVNAILDSAELRTDLNAMRVVIVESEEISADATYANKVLARETELASVAQVLEQELIVAFSHRVHVLAIELAPEGEEPETEPAVLAAVKAAGGTHAVLGSFQRRDDELVITVRLIDARTRLIIAAERLTLPYTHFSDVGRLAFAAGRDPLDPLGAGALAAVGLAALGGNTGGSVVPVVLTQGAGAASVPAGQLLRFPAQAGAPEGLAYGADTWDAGKSTSLEYGATNAPIGGVQPAVQEVVVAGNEPAETKLAAQAERSSHRIVAPVVRFQKSKVLKRRGSTGGPASERMRALGRTIDPE